MSFRDARALVFDLDGTLVDSLADIALHLNDALVARGYGPRSLTEIGEWVGHGAEQLVVRAVPHPENVAATFADFRERYRARPVVHTCVFPALPAVLDAIAPGRSLAVLSNKPHELTVRITEQLLGTWPWRVVVGQRAGHAKKPDPAALIAIAVELGVPPEACVMIGDSEVDIATAKAAGVPSVAVAWGLRTLDVLVAAQPDVIVHTPAELGALFTS